MRTQLRRKSLGGCEVRSDRFKGGIGCHPAKIRGLPGHLVFNHGPLLRNPSRAKEKKVS
jgi:hypothetical protein